MGRESVLFAMWKHALVPFLAPDKRSFSAGLFDAAKDLSVDREIFADRAAVWARVEGAHARLDEAEILAQARAAGFSIG